MSIKKRMQLVENGIPQDVDILTSAECVTFEDGDTLQTKLDNGDLASSDVLGDVDSLDGSVVDSLNELNESAKETSELVSELANRGGVTSALSKEVCNGEWVSVSTLPYDFYNGSAVVYKGEIHILGTGKTGKTTSHYKWNGSSWESASTLPYSLSGYERAVIYNDELHIVGSNDSSNNNYKKHYKWDGSSWTSVSTTPYTLTYVSAITYDGCIHILGGYATTSEYKYHYKWNGSSWVSSTSLPYYFYNGGSIVYNNELHIFGSGYGSYDKYHYKYNGSSWSKVSTLPASFFYSSVVSYNNEIYITTTVNSITTIYKYNGTVWESVTDLSYNAHTGNAVVYNNQIHMLGGSSNQAGTVTYYTRHYSAKLGTYLKGYTKADTELYLPISTTPITSNLTATEDGYTVTEDGYVEILLNE